MATFLLYGFPQKSFLDDLTATGKEVSFLVPEGRPGLGGAKELAPQLAAKGWPVRIITDNMMAYCFSKGMAEAAYIFSQRDTKEGAWCPIGSLVLAIAARAHGVPVNLLPANKELPQGSEAENQALFFLAGKRIAPEGIKSYVPLVELVPWKYITGGKRQAI